MRIESCNPDQATAGEEVIKFLINPAIAGFFIERLNKKLISRKFCGTLRKKYLRLESDVRRT
jgi:hypothetical protein